MLNSTVVLWCFPVFYLFGSCAAYQRSVGFWCGSLALCVFEESAAYQWSAILGSSEGFEEGLRKFRETSSTLNSTVVRRRSGDITGVGVQWWFGVSELFCIFIFGCCKAYDVQWVTILTLV